MPPSRATEMAQMGFTVSSAKAANGETVHINDHVYASSPWSERDGTPYIIARILDFLPPGAAKLRGSTKTPKNELHVRLALYYRPSDISGRAVSDFRLLLAAIHTIVEPISVVRGRCYVRHKDKIEDLIKWKHTPDHFYFVKFFDPYIKREYEVLRTANVNNIPAHVKEVLLTRYEYLLIEKEMVADMLDAYKCCAICTQWAASLNSVRCEHCKEFYHMQCLTPPLAAKPAKGYSWGCLPCTIQRRKDVESEKYRFVTNGGSAPPARKSTKKEKAAITNTPDVMFRGWPWRYFGLYSNAEDALNPEDLIYPRAVTRVGTKYQANVMTVEEQAVAERKRQESLASPAGPSKQIYERGYDPGERDDEPTITLISKPSEELAAYMEAEMKLKMPVPPYDVRRMNKAVESYTAMGPEKALSYMQSLKLADFDPIEWTPEETRTFEQALELYGGLNAVAVSRSLGKSAAEVLKFSYMWKNKKLKSENDLIRQHRKVHAAHARNNRGTLGPPSLGKIRSRAESETSDDEGSLHNASYVSANRMQCAACSTRTSNVWWKCPRTVQGVAMCESCGSNYRKYGVISFVKADDAKGRGGEKKEPKSRRTKGDTGSGTSTPVPQSAPKLPPCVCCRKMEPKAAMARCKTCTFSAHAGCYGIPPEAVGPNWECELCANAREPETNIDVRCMLCPRDNSLLTSRIKSKKAPVDFDLLSVLKPTEGCQWAHLLCATWFPDVQYTDGTTFKKVEGISTIPDESWETPCSLCMQQDGAVIQCTDCGLDVHPSCAWLAGFRFGFEFTIIKAAKRDAGNYARFKDETGIMAPGCWCKTHDLSGRSIHDMFDVDPERGENALQVYTNMYKTIPASESFALLRKAHRLDLVESRVAQQEQEHAMDIDIPHVNGTTALVDDTDTKPTVPPHRACASCAVEVSPRWHTDKQGATVCHQCWFKAVHARPGVNGVGGSVPGVALTA